MRNRSAIAAFIAGVSLLADAPSSAVVFNATGAISFDVRVSLQKISDIDFGTVKNNACTYSISTTGTVTGSPAGSCAHLSGTTSAANILVTGSATQLLSISAGSYTASGTVTPSNARCSYDGGASGSCTIAGAAAAGGGKTLLVGVDVTTTGGESSGVTYQPTFTITVNYQ